MTGEILDRLEQWGQGGQAGGGGVPHSSGAASLFAMHSTEDRALHLLERSAPQLHPQLCKSLRATLMH